ncbi:MAG: hypothetical protein MI861_28880 [Pirellulales bacterium]|nr:hypothetical protein [Pirellulales bacterium]
MRVAVLFYLLRVGLKLSRRGNGLVPELSDCMLWSLGCVFYLAHVILAFTFVHQWSHQQALDHTAAETARLTGWSRGEGLWVNYGFTVIWIADSFRITRAYLKRKPTSRRIDQLVGYFFAFIVFNATVVFGPAIYRYLAIPVGLILAAAAVRGKRRGH